VRIDAAKTKLEIKPVEDESGQAVVVVAVFLGLVAMGFLALALDAGYLFRERQMVQTAADAAAVAAAEEVASGNSGNEQMVANAVVQLNGFDTTLAKNPAVVTFPTPSGNFTGGSYVAVKVAKPIPTFFMGAFSSRFATQTVSAMAIAGGGQLSQTCICLNGTVGKTLYVSGGSHLTATGCGIVDNSSASNAVAVDGGSSLSASSLGLSSSSTWNTSNVSTWSGSNVTGGSNETLNGVANGPPIPGVSSCAATLPAPIAPTGCATTDPGSSYGTWIFAPGCYQNLSVGANGSTCTLTPGIYVITGSLHFASGANGHSNLGGNGVFFYLTSTASLAIDNGANVNLVAGGAAQSGGGTAPSLGASYDGIAIYQASGNASALMIQGGSSSYISGAIYAPSAAVSVGNGSSMTFPIGGVYAKSLSVTGGTTLNVIQDTNEGAVSIGSPKLVQ
jgi:Flp pilus assembly protein TadG